MITRRAIFAASAGLLGLAASADAKGLFSGGLLSGGLFSGKLLARERPPQAGDIPFANWTDDEPLYTFYPGDRIEVQVPAAPELNRQAQIGPDGRITLPLIGQVMAAYKSVPQIQQEVETRYADGILRDSHVEVFPGDTAPMRVIVGGEVKNPGPVEMMGDMDALQAVFAAGGFLHTAKGRRVMIIRRGSDGGAMVRYVDLQDALSNRPAQMTALRRFDIIYVPRSNVAEAGVWAEQWINNLIPGGLMNYFAYKSFN